MISSTSTIHDIISSLTFSAWLRPSGRCLTCYHWRPAPCPVSHAPRIDESSSGARWSRWKWRLKCKLKWKSAIFWCFERSISRKWHHDTMYLNSLSTIGIGFNLFYNTTQVSETVPIDTLKIDNLKTPTPWIWRRQSARRPAERWHSRWACERRRHPRDELPTSDTCRRRTPGNEIQIQDYLKFGLLGSSRLSSRIYLYHLRHS